MDSVANIIGNNTKWAFTGSAAMKLHGINRRIGNIDVVVNGENVADVVRSFELSGYNKKDPTQFVSKYARMVQLTKPNTLNLDIMIAGKGLAPKLTDKTVIPFYQQE